MDIKEIEKIRYNLILAVSNLAKREIVTEYKCNNKAIRAILNKPMEWVAQGRSLFLYGGVGRGKTLGAANILKAYAKKVAESDVFQEYPIYYISLPEFLNECKRDISREIKVTPREIEILKVADLVVMDEIGSIKETSSYERDILFEIIDERTNELRATIYISNNTGESLRRALGEQIYSRVFVGSDKVAVTGEDRRDNG